MNEINIKELDARLDAMLDGLTSEGFDKWKKGDQIRKRMNEIGRERHAVVDGQDCIVYLSLMTNEKGLERRDHCYRYGRPSHEVINKDATIEFGEFLDGFKGGHLPEEKRWTPSTGQLLAAMMQSDEADGLYE